MQILQYYNILACDFICDLPVLDFSAKTLDLLMTCETLTWTDLCNIYFWVASHVRFISRA